MTRSEFMALVRQRGGYRIRVRLLAEREGGRRAPVLGDSDYRANWSVGSSDPEAQTGGPIFLDGGFLAPGQEGNAVLVPLFEAAVWQDVHPGTELTGFEGRRVVARAVVTEVLPPNTA